MVFGYACAEALIQQSARVAHNRAGAPGLAVGGWGRSGKKPFGGVGEGVGVPMAFLPAPDKVKYSKDGDGREEDLDLSGQVEESA